MMKKILLVFFIGCCSLSLFSQVTNEGIPASWSLIEEKSNFQAIELPKFDMKKIEKEDLVNDKNRAKSWRFGYKHAVDYGINNAGNWIETEDGDRIWRILFESEGALSLNFIFDEFFMPEGGKVYLYSDDRKDLLGAYTDVQNQESGRLGTWIVQGEKVWIEYFEPNEVRGKGRLHIEYATHGYRTRATQKSLEDSGNCNHDVDCSIGNDVEDFKSNNKDGVALILNGGADWCSGTLINNTDNDKKPYFLTANHCLDSGGTGDWTFRFGWISPNPICGQNSSSTDGPKNMTISGATLRVNNSNSDVVLLELNGAIPDDWNRVWAGWDRSDDIPSFTFGIHHPSGDIMKVCRDNNPPTKVAQNAGGNSPVAQTWDINGIINNSGANSGNATGWEIGVTEGGSSGSALYDPNGRIIGQLYGGRAACSGTNDNNGHDYYGRFAVSWDSGSSASTRLRDWLDPAGTNPMTLDAIGNTLSVNDEFLEENISIFPNPTSGLVTVRATGLVGDLSYEIFNLLGQSLKSDVLQNETIQLNNLNDNIYFIKITEVDSNKILVKKVVLSK